MERYYVSLDLYTVSFSTMALVNVINVAVLDNPTRFSNPFQFDITFECVSELRDGKCCRACSSKCSCDHTFPIFQTLNGRLLMLVALKTQA